MGKLAPKQQSIEEAAGEWERMNCTTFNRFAREGYIAGARSITDQLLDDIEMNLDDWCRTPLVMATKFRDKQFIQLDKK